MPRRVLLLVLLLLLSACRGVHSSSCALPDGRVLDVYGRPNGLYGVVDANVGAAPLARFDRMQLRGEGVDSESGKRWLRVHFAEDEAGNFGSFTATPSGRSLAVVVDGEVACHHKIRESVIGSDLQISCCNPHACDRWKVLLENQAGRN